jgi:hypothetical protein
MGATVGRESPCRCWATSFQLQRVSNFVDLGLPKKAATDWWKYWFYVKEATPEGEVKMPPYSAEPSAPRFLRVKSLPEGQHALVGQMLDRIIQLDREGLTSINLYNCWLSRRLIPLQQTPTRCGNTLGRAISHDR